jgi:hypothetical protein
MTRDAGFSLDADAKLSRNALFGLLQPVPNLRLRGADAGRKGLLTAHNLTRSFQWFVCHRKIDTDFLVIRQTFYRNLCWRFSTKLSVA